MWQMFNTTRDQTRISSWDNPCAVSDLVDCSTPENTSFRYIQWSGKCVSCYGTNYLQPMIESPRCRQHKQDEYVAIRPLNRNEIIDVDDEIVEGADPGALSWLRSFLGNANGNDHSAGEEDKLGSEKRIWLGKQAKIGMSHGKAIEDVKGKCKQKEKGKGTDEGKCIMKQTPGEMICLVTVLSCCRRKWMSLPQTWRAN